MYQKRQYTYIFCKGELNKKLISRFHKKSRLPRGKDPKFLIYEVFQNALKKSYHTWEGDLIMGAKNKSAIAVEPRYVILIPLENKDALRKSMERAF